MATISAVISDGANSVQLPFVVQAFWDRSEGCHDMMSLATRPIDDSVLSAMQSMPVHVAVVASAIRAEYYGYLDVAQPQKIALGETVALIHVVGTTSLLRDVHVNAWRDQLPQTIAAEVLSKYRLGLEIDGTVDPIDWISQTERESDWQFLNRLASKVGLSLTVDGVVIRMRSVLQEERRAAQRAYPTLILPNKIGGTNVQSFSVTRTLTPDGLDYKDTLIRGVDKLGAAFEYSTAYLPGGAIDPGSDPVVSDKSVDSLQDAITEISRIAEQSRWTYKATLTGVGYLATPPGEHVLIVDRDGPYSGFWYIVDAHYELSLNTASTTLTLTRNDPTQNIVPLAINHTRPPLVVLSNNEWQVDRDWTVVL